MAHLSELLFQFEEGVTILEDPAIPLREALGLFRECPRPFIELGVPLIDDVVHGFSLRGILGNTSAIT